jgi:predicted DNA-binding transcriptional regulator AlpA
LNAVPKLADLVAEPGKAGLVPPEAIPAMLGDLERLKGTLWARLMLPQGPGKVEQSADGDRLLAAREAAAKLGMSADYLYRRSRNLPFTVRLGRKLRFSEAGIERYIRARVGR